MKTKMTLLVLATAIITLSFSFVMSDNNAKKVETTTAKSNDAPVGGFVSERN